VRVPAGERGRDTAARGLALVGYRATGKTTVGQIVAERLNLPFRDMDEALETRFGQSILEFFAERGEPAFRDEEALALAELVTVPGLVLSTGGGVVLRAVNRNLLRSFGTVVWLTADPRALAERLSLDRSNQRPALTPAGSLDEVAAVLAQRLPFYQEVADLIVDTTGKSPAEVADAIIASRGAVPGGPGALRA
jgi:shikimate kinase